MTSIGENAFCGCSSLTQISLPASVTSIGPNIFKNCPLLPLDNKETVHINETNNDTNNKSSLSFKDNTDADIVNNNNNNNNSNKSGWRLANNNINNNNIFAFGGNSNGNQFTWKTSSNNHYQNHILYIFLLFCIFFGIYIYKICF